MYASRVLRTRARYASVAWDGRPESDLGLTWVSDFGVRLGCPTWVFRLGCSDLGADLATRVTLRAAPEAEISSAGTAAGAEATQDLGRRDHVVRAH